MIKAVVLSPSYNYYTLYIRNKKLNPYEYPYYMGNNLQKIRGFNCDLPFYFLEGWSDNEKYTKEDIDYIKNRYEITPVAKGWIENEGLVF